MRFEDYVNPENPFESLVRTTCFVDTKALQKFVPGAVHLLGFPFDATTSFRPGARFGASAIRDVSMNLEEYSPYLQRGLRGMSLVDMGNIPFLGPRFDWMLEFFLALTKDINLKRDKIKLLSLGGEHSISYCPISLYLKNYPDLVLIHLDAHTDFRDGFLGEKFSHASIIYRVFEHFLPTQKLIQYGIRSGSRAEFEFMEEKGTLYKSQREFLDEVEAIAKDRPIYLTLDLDYFDPCFMPGTGTPEAGGEDFHSFVKLIKILQHKNLVGADVVELAPQLDASGASSSFAAKVVRELLLLLGANHV